MAGSLCHGDSIAYFSAASGGLERTYMQYPKSLL